MKKIVNKSEVRDYFASQIAEFSNKCMKNAKRQLEGMKARKDQKLEAFGEDAILGILYNNLFYSGFKVAFVHYSDDTVQLYIGNKNEPAGDTIRVDDWQFVGKVDEDERMDAYIDSIIGLYNLELDYINKYGG